MYIEVLEAAGPGSDLVEKSKAGVFGQDMQQILLVADVGDSAGLDAEDSQQCLGRGQTKQLGFGLLCLLLVSERDLTMPVETLVTIGSELDQLT